MLISYHYRGGKNSQKGRLAVQTANFATMTHGKNSKNVEKISDINKGPLGLP